MPHAYPTKGSWLSLFLVILGISIVACSTSPTDQTNHHANTIAQRATEIGMFVGSISGDRREGPSVILNPEYAASLITNFNALTVENFLKGQRVSPAPGVYDFALADQVVQFAEENDLRVRGHTLVWARMSGQPTWLADEVNSAADPAARLREIIEDHIAEVMGRYRGRIAIWDVVNEPLHLFNGDLDPHSFYQQTLGLEYIDLAFRAAREADPDALLGLNETLVINNEAKFGALLFLVSHLKAQGTPLDVVGLQAQFILNPPPSREQLRSKLRALASLDVMVEITELNIPLSFYGDRENPLAEQAAAYADVFGACLDVPQCTGITTWGLYDGETWLDAFFPWVAPARPSLLDENFARKPAYEAVLELLNAYQGPRKAVPVDQ